MSTRKTNKWPAPPVDIETNKPAPIGTDDPQITQASNWIIAIDAWDYCDSQLLDAMLRRHPIPFELQPVIADIISGERPQNKKGAAKLKIPAGHRLLVAGLYRELWRGIVEPTLQRKTTHDYHDTADELGIEVAEMRKRLWARAKQFRAEVAETAGISIETLDSMVDSLNEKIKKYPDI